MSITIAFSFFTHDNDLTQHLTQCTVVKKKMEIKFKQVEQEQIYFHCNILSI